jgi:DNA-directed RNA polymerase subunit M/transcription elongation factor TFIIS
MWYIYDMTVHYCKKCKNVLIVVYHTDLKKYVLLCNTCSKTTDNEDEFIYEINENVLYNESSSKNIDILDTLIEENLYDPICPFVMAKCDKCAKETKFKTFPHGQKKYFVCTTCKSVYIH